MSDMIYIGPDLSRNEWVVEVHSLLGDSYEVIHKQRFTHKRFAQKYYNHLCKMQEEKDVNQRMEDTNKRTLQEIFKS